VHIAQHNIIMHFVGVIIMVVLYSVVSCNTSVYTITCLAIPGKYTVESFLKDRTPPN